MTPDVRVARERHDKPEFAVHVADVMQSRECQAEVVLSAVELGEPRRLLRAAEFAASFLSQREEVRRVTPANVVVVRQLLCGVLAHRFEHAQAPIPAAGHLNQPVVDEIGKGK